MVVSKIRLKNWRNFISADLPLRNRVFVVGANASGKSNFLDVFRFLRDIAKKQGGGLQQAVAQRGGMSKLRCLSARSDPKIEIEVELSDTDAEECPKWRYSIALKQEQWGKRRLLLVHERVWKYGELILERPSHEDREDDERMTLTFLESPTTNGQFREVAEFLGTVAYLHLVPQLLRTVESSAVESDGEDYYGKNFLVRVAKTPERTRNARLKRIIEALQVAVPQFQEIKEVKDDSGAPHLAMRLKNWRPKAGWQWEDQFSDGTLRMLGMFWALLESESLLLFEEPELSLNDRIVAQLPAQIWKLQSVRGRQVILSTHSYSILSDPGIDLGEIIILIPGTEGTEASVASSRHEIAALVAGGMTPGEAVLPVTNPVDVATLSL